MTEKQSGYEAKSAGAGGIGQRASLLGSATIGRIKAWLETELIASEEEIRTELASSDDGQIKLAAEIVIRLIPVGKAQVRCSLRVPRAAYKTEPQVFDCQMSLPGM